MLEIGAILLMIFSMKERSWPGCSNRAGKVDAKDLQAGLISLLRSLTHSAPTTWLTTTKIQNDVAYTSEQSTYKTHREMHYVKITLDSSKKPERRLRRSCYKNNLEAILLSWLQRIFDSLVHDLCHARLPTFIDRSKFLVRDFLQVYGIEGYGSAFESLFELIAGRLQRANVLHFDMERMLHRSVREKYIIGASKSMQAHLLIVGLK